MKKILTSVLVIGLVLVGGYYATSALFTDTEVSTNNVFETGTIDIAVDGENPWVSDAEYQLLDMKPSYTDYIDFEITNVGSNPANVWKTLKNYNFYDVETSEPECVAEGGHWVDLVEQKDYCERNTPAMNIARWINYDMRVELYDVQGGEKVWWETIYMDKDDVKLSDLRGEKMYLGMIPVGWTMKVMQSYHMVTETDNRFQGDGMTFDMELYAEQLTNTITLENKYESNSDLSHHVWDGKYAEFEYKVMDRELNGELRTYGVPNGTYTLVAWEDENHEWNWADRGEALVLANVTVSGDTVSGDTVSLVSLDLGQDLTNAKVWLVPGTYVEGNASTFDWNATGTYFETGLMDYYDADK